MAVITPTGHACGAVVTDLDAAAVNDAEAAELRSALDEHHVLVFPDQRMSNDELERFSEAFGRLGTDPWFIPIEGSDHIAEIRRDADEEAPLFGEGWHSDWSFLDSPPVATCLLGLTIPPVGGDTLFANQHLAYDRLPDDLEITLKPVLFAGLLGHWDMKGPAEIPAKRVQTYRYCHWLAEKRGIPFKAPPRHPFNPLPLLRLARMLQEKHHEEHGRYGTLDEIGFKPKVCCSDSKWNMFSWYCSAWPLCCHSFRLKISGERTST